MTLTSLLLLHKSISKSYVKRGHYTGSIRKYLGNLHLGGLLNPYDKKWDSLINVFKTNTHCYVTHVKVFGYPSPSSRKTLLI